MKNPLLNAILRCIGGFAFLFAGIVMHSQILVLLSMVNFALVGAWLYLDSRKV